MTTVVDAPTRADDVQLIGAMVGSGYRTPPSLVRRGDGQTLQLTPLLFEVLDAIDGRRTPAEIAVVVSERMRRGVSGEMVEAIVDQQLRPLGLLKRADGTDPLVKRSNPLLALKLKVAVTNPETTRRITDPFRVLFRPLVTIAVVAAFVAICWWVFFEKGLAPAAYDAFQRPELLLLVFVVTVLSGGFHEFGHAAAARYSGARPGAMGAGVYLVWPAFYTDVTDSYRLGRGGRIRTDLGGLYFNALVVLGTFVWWWFSGWEALLLLVATQVLQMVHQLLPTLRFDGYHLLADLAGVPDLYHRIKPTLLGLLPHRWNDPQNKVLKPGARALITLWVLVTVPMMALMLFALVTAVPRMLGSAWAAVAHDAAGVGQAWRTGGPIDVAGHAFEVLAIVLPVMAGALILSRFTLRWSTGLARWSRGSLPKRFAASVLSFLVITGLMWAWWPGPGVYRPIGPDERGVLTSLLPTQQPAVPLARPVVAPGSAATTYLAGTTALTATFADDAKLPTQAHPQLAMVLVPADADAVADAVPGSSDVSADDGVWVFPFDKPLPPEEGDNQALAVNTTDGSVTYDVAFAMVWVDDDEALNVNEAHAYASCNNCVTVAVAFQVVLVSPDTQVVVPQNLSVAANYKCYECITVALANQLVLTVEDKPGHHQMVELRKVWKRLLRFGKHIREYTLTEIMEKLEKVKAQIQTILHTAPPASDQTSTASPSASPSDGTDPSSTTSATPSATTSSTAPSSSTTGSTDPTTSDTSSSTTTDPSPSPTDTSSAPSESPSPTASDSPTATTSATP